MNKFHYVVLGFVVAMVFSAVIVMKVEKRAWNSAVDASARLVLTNTNKYGGLDQTYDLGYQRCQEAGFDDIKELIRE